jgi:aspartyl-tRNA(Asn)/glutamyl-tRNA(Gln) amidotransferase subunit A
VAPLSGTFDTIGPITGSVEDARLVFEALAAAECPAGAVMPARMTLGIVDPEQLAPVDDDVQAVVSASVGRLQQSGIRCVPFQLPHAVGEYQHRNGIIMAAEAYSALGAWAEDFKFPMDPFVRRRLLSGRQIPPEQYREAQEERILAKAEFLDKLNGIDFVVLPTTPLPAVPLDQVDESVAPMSRFTRLANYLDLCAISVPIGRTPGDLPVGLQIIARGHQERCLLDFAALVERLSTARREKH